MRNFAERHKREMKGLRSSELVSNVFGVIFENLFRGQFARIGVNARQRVNGRAKEDERMRAEERERASKCDMK